LFNVPFGRFMLKMLLDIRFLLNAFFLKTMPMYRTKKQSFIGIGDDNDQM